MYRHQIVLGILPLKRNTFAFEPAVAQKERCMKILRDILPEVVTLVEIDDICEGGVIDHDRHVPAILEKFRRSGVEALFALHTNFGMERVLAAVAMELRLPTLLWGCRDEQVNTDVSRGMDTQCGMFAASKVLLRAHVPFSYLMSCYPEDASFRKGFDTFIRTVSIVKSLRGLRIAKIGSRPPSFLCVTTDEGALMSKFGIIAESISPSAIAARVGELIAEDGADFRGYLEDLTSRIDFTQASPEEVRKTAALKLAIQQFMLEANCSVGAVECWPAFRDLLGVKPCLAAGELTDLGMPLACENDINGAVTLAMVRGCTLGQSPPFLADMTIRHPENDNAELLWHCGPFPYSLRHPDSKPWYKASNERWRMRDGDLTAVRFDDLDGKHYLFAGEGKTVEGPETTGTYLWMEVDNWPKWEEKLMLGPYIHHVGCMYGHYQSAFREAAKYLGLIYDAPGGDGPLSI